MDSVIERRRKGSMTVHAYLTVVQLKLGRKITATEVALCREWRLQRIVPSDAVAKLRDRSGV